MQFYMEYDNSKFSFSPEIISNLVAFMMKRNIIFDFHLDFQSILSKYGISVWCGKWYGLYIFS